MYRLINLNSCMKSATLSQCKRKFGAMSQMSYSTEWCMSYVVNITFCVFKVGGKYSILVRKVTDYL